jgi:putative endonuclease
VSAIATGNLLENAAIKHLQQHNVKILQRNFKCKYGEIDLIARDKQDLLFVEVRYRQNAICGTAAESVTAAKQQKIIYAANFFLQVRSWAANMYCRFDVIAINGSIESPTIEWIKGAFHA